MSLDFDGLWREAFWKRISEIESIDTSDYPVHKGGEVKGFRPQDFIALVLTAIIAALRLGNRIEKISYICVR